MVRVGIDLGATNIKLGLVSINQRILAKKIIPTQAHKRAADIFQIIVEHAKKLLIENQIKEENCHQIGIGVPGIISYSNSIVILANNLGWKQIDLPKQLNQLWNKKFVMDNDAYCACLAEITLHKEVYEHKNILFLTIGSGIGGCLVVDGKIVKNSKSFNTEPGHFFIHKEGRKCNCGQLGCFEAYASLNALILQTQEALLTQNALHPLKKIGKLDAKMIFDAYWNNDPFIVDVVSDYMDHFAYGLASLNHMLRPEMIVLGGGLSYQEDNFLHLLEQRMQVYNFASLTLPKLQFAKLKNDAGIVGASLLIQ